MKIEKLNFIIAFLKKWYIKKIKIKMKIEELNFFTANLKKWDVEVKDELL